MVFDWIYGLEGANKGKKYYLYFLSPPEIIVENEASSAVRNDEDANGLHYIEEHLIPQYKTVLDVWHYITHEHVMYTATGLVNKSQGIQ
jgi:hypothetical protein